MSIEIWRGTAGDVIQTDADAPKIAHALFEVCVRPNCGRLVYARSLCTNCYARMRNEGRLDEFQKRGINSAIERQRPVGHRRLKTDGYVSIKTQYGVEQEHRVVMEDAIGRRLVRGETVHHINGDRADNRIENLELWYRSQPAGQRVVDLIAYVAACHRSAIIAALGAEA